MAKRTCELVRRITIKYLKDKGYLWNENKLSHISWSHEGERIGFAGIHVDQGNYLCTVGFEVFSHIGNAFIHKETIRLTTTPCHLGGQRYWFVCPMEHGYNYCGSRVGVLYLLNGKIGCRKCHDLAYQSQQVTHTGFWQFLSRVMRHEERLYNQYEDMRVKKWRGAPTKRYQKWLEKSDRLYDYYGRLLERSEPHLNVAE